MAMPRIGLRVLGTSPWPLSATGPTKLVALRALSTCVRASASTFVRRPSPRERWTTDARRAFSSSRSAGGWLPASLGGASAPPPPAAVVERHFDDAALVAAPSGAAIPLDEPCAAVEAPSYLISAANDALISSGTLDLTELATSWGPHPIMRLQSLFLQLHEHLPVLGYTPWYILIPAVTLVVRLLLFPFQVRSQANAARMAIIQPRMLAGMEKVKAAKAAGDVSAQQAAMVDVQQLMSANNVNPIRGLAFPLMQGAVFMSMFFALKGLAGADISSLATEGFGWVKDLTAPDPYWALPLTSTALTMATLEFGMDQTASTQTANMQSMKVMFRVLLIVCLPFVAHFPAILLMYWTVNNFISLLQSQFLKIPAVRAMLNIPVIPPKPLPGQPGYVKEPGFAEAFRNVQVGISNKVEETRARADEVRAAEAAIKEQERTTEVYVPRGPMPKVKGPLVEATEKVAGTGEVKGEIVAERKPLGAAEEKARKVLQARQRRK